ncbi:MAG TPA: NAD(P)-dependent oxidoreductase [Ktedonobacterales bacterium]|nr:NAD(P)-dependent oxidoreductase [Ktedonobacterales bacterium]
MRVFVAGATGAIGNQLVPQRVAGGHTVVAMTGTPKNAAMLRAAGAEPVVVDAFDRAALIEAVKRAAPVIVIHQLSALTKAKNYKKFDDEFALTNRLRTEVADYLLEATRTAGARRFIAQGYGNWNYERTGTGPKTEEDPLDPNPPQKQRESLEAIRYLENAVVHARDIEGIALRYGKLYGPGTGIAADGDIVAMVRTRGLPMVGNGAGIWSLIHIADAASATVAAIERGAPGAYNVVDDEPAPVATWLPELARILGAKPPLHIPAWLGRLIIGEVGVSMMTQIRGATNAKAVRELDWKPSYTTWRQGFRAGLGK